MAQRLAPKGKSMVSSLMMGLAFGTGGMMTPITGKLADLHTLKPVLFVLAFIPLITVALIALVPESRLQDRTGASSVP
jgi:FSR family fosmidomycin resistance protein-like MFS transporter